MNSDKQIYQNRKRIIITSKQLYTVEYKMTHVNNYLKLAPYTWILRDENITDDFPPWVWEWSDYNV